MLHIEMFYNNGVRLAVKIFSSILACLMSFKFSDIPSEVLETIIEDRLNQKLISGKSHNSENIGESENGK